MTRKYYALYAPYGIRAVYGGHHVPTVYTFGTKAERDAWVADSYMRLAYDNWSGCDVWVKDTSTPRREACTAAEAKRWA